MKPELGSRQRIINSGRDLFYARSYSDVGVQEICNTANVKKGSFYHFFKSKHDLAIAVIDEFDQAFSGTLLPLAFNDDIPPLARLDRLVQLTYEYHKQQKMDQGMVLGCPYANLASEVSTLYPILNAKIEASFKHLMSQFELVIQEAVTCGDIPEPESIKEAAESLFAYLEGASILAKTRNSPELFLSLGKKIAKLLN